LPSRDIANWIKENHLEGMDKFPVSVEINPHLDKKEEMVKMAKEIAGICPEFRHQNPVQSRGIKSGART
jgi:transaldolase